MKPPRELVSLLSETRRRILGRLDQLIDACPARCEHGQPCRFPTTLHTADHESACCRFIAPDHRFVMQGPSEEWHVLHPPACEAAKSSCPYETATRVRTDGLNCEGTYGVRLDSDGDTLVVVA